MKCSAILTFFLCSIIQCFAQVDLECLAKSEMASYSALKNYQTKRASGENFELIYAALNLRPNMKTAYLKGDVNFYIKASGAINQMSFDLRTEITVDSIIFRGSKMNFTHNTSDILNISLNQTIAANTIDSIRIFYQGLPQQNNRAYERNVTASGPIIATLSEPYGAHYWWPCRENLSDKIDSLDVYVTVDTMYQVASIGLLQSVTVNDSMHTWHWKHRYPIVTYLVAFSASRYSIYSDNALLKNGKQLDILNYVFPHNETDARTKTKATVPMMQFFDSMFGFYPFYNEKYGHAQFTVGGGMEHQTMSFMGNFGYDLIAHELAHQWFGDKLTCGTWHDLWLNESFATYCNLLCYESLKTKSEFINQLKKYKTDVLSQPGGSVMSTDTTNVNALFNYRTTYQKGALVLHQLRWIMGDSIFFSGIRNYLADPKLSYGFAKSKDLQFYMEQASGLNLTDYFNDCIIGEGYPIYALKWKQEGTMVSINVNQTVSHPSVSLYNAPLPMVLKGIDRDTLVVIPINNADETLKISLPFQVKELFFDPDEWILGKHSIQFEMSVKQENITIYPNPSNNFLYLAINNMDLNAYTLTDATGKEVVRKTYETPLHKGAIETLNLHDFCSGIYIIQFQSNGNTYASKIVINK